MFPTILIVDDEASILQSLSGILADEGFEVITASNGYEALQTIDRESPDLVLLDIWMPGIDGIETLKEIKKENPALQVIMITGHGTIETAVNATKFGAFDFIEKPLSIDKVIVAINNALNFRRLEEENRYLRKKMLEKNSISGNSPPINAIKQQIAVTAPTDAWVLITGENGTGKELVARAIHLLSNRAEQPLINVNCAAIPENLIDSELFGHEKGSFPGASTKKTGQFELANKGTLFLDEIGDMNLKTQAKILRVLQDQAFQRVGGSRMLKVDVRLIASSNKDLETEIEKGNFREDLYFRLNVIPIEVPPLRERNDDIPVLVTTFLQECAQKYGDSPKSVDETVMDLLYRYAWPGNVRELKNLVERLAIMVRGELITINDVPAPYNPAGYRRAAGDKTPLFKIDNLEKALQNFEKKFLARKLSENHHNFNETAGILGITPDNLKQRLKKHQIL